MSRKQSAVIKRVLKSTNRTQRQLAKEIGISESVMSRVVNGQQRLGVDSAIVLSRLSGIPLEVFFQ